MGVVKSHITASKSLWIYKKKMVGKGNKGEEVSHKKLYSFFAIDCTKVAQQNRTGVYLERAESKRSLILKVAQ